MDYETELYSEVSAANDAVERLHALGYTHDEISVVMEDKTRGIVGGLIGLGVGESKAHEYEKGLKDGADGCRLRRYVRNSTR